MFDPGGYCKEKLDVSHSQGLKEGGGVSPTSWTSFTLVKPDKKFFSDHYLRESWFLP